MAKSVKFKKVQDAVRKALSERILDGFEVLEDQAGGKFFIGQINVETSPEATIELTEDTKTGAVVYRDIIAYEDEGIEFHQGYPNPLIAMFDFGAEDKNVSPNKAAKLADDLLDELFEIRRKDWYSSWTKNLKKRRTKSIREDGKYRGRVVFLKSTLENPAKEQAVGGLLLAGLLGYAIAKRSR
tara:strand:+ start:334 stop:885 length:552 start_codon:yes stop_codon:yes gene_type:complete